jgi:hypothetical protein
VGSEAPRQRRKRGTLHSAAKACPGEVDPVRRQGHASTEESTAFSADIGSLSEPISTENAAGLETKSLLELNDALGGDMMQGK